MNLIHVFIILLQRKVSLFYSVDATEHNVYKVPITIVLI